MNKRFSKIKWEVIIAIVVSCTSIFVAVKANDISKTQALIAKNEALPTFEVDESVVENNVSGYKQDCIIKISNLSGKMNNYQTEVITFLHCGYFESDTASYEVVDIPIENYFILSVNKGVTKGVIEEKNTLGNYDKIKNLKESILLFNKEMKIF